MSEVIEPQALTTSAVGSSQSMSNSCSPGEEEKSVQFSQFEEGPKIFAKAREADLPSLLPNFLREGH